MPAGVGAGAGAGETSADGGNGAGGHGELTAIEGPEGPMIVAATLPPAPAAAEPAQVQQQVQMPREAAIAPTSDSPTFDVLFANGWKEQRKG